MLIRFMMMMMAMMIIAIVVVDVDENEMLVILALITLPVRLPFLEKGSADLFIVFRLNA